MANLPLVLDDTTRKIKTLPSFPGGGGGGIPWQVVNSNTNMTAGNAYIVDATGGTVDMTLPASVSIDSVFIVHAYNGTARIVSNGNVIRFVGSGNDLTVDDGETAYLVGRTTGNLEIV